MTAVRLSDSSRFATAADAEALRVRGGVAESVHDVVAAEVPVVLAFNGRDFAVMMATPSDLEDFAIGFCVTEGIVGAAADVQIERVDDMMSGLRLALAIPAARADALAGRERNLAGRTGCGLCGIATLEEALRTLPRVPARSPISSQALLTAFRSLGERQPLNARTNAVHAAAFCAPDGNLLYVREDVGRHNALDKLVGALLRNGVDPALGFALVTSRCSMEMAQKAVAAGFPVLAAISAPTSLAISIAAGAGLTLAAFLREGGFSLYAHPEGVILSA